ncbi:MAG: hypothetical protein HY958_09040 [Bacteroidia bacterium]|nr:hypothetical protein [Bacteroidia bacterium]
METGHQKNIANLATLIAHCKTLGADYAPSRNALKIVNLETLYTTANDSINSEDSTSVNSTEAVWNKATNEREIVFSPLKTLATKIINALDSTEATEQAVKDARTLIRKIEGARAPKSKKALDAFIDSTHITTSAAGTEPVEVAEEHNFISTSQQSYDLLVEHFSKLITLLNAEPNYAPNEEKLKLVTLKALLASMKATNKAVIDTLTALEDARIIRDKIMYEDKTGLCDIGLDTKKYIRSVFGSTSPKYKQISSLEFRKIKRK